MELATDFWTLLLEDFIVLSCATLHFLKPGIGHESAVLKSSAKASKLG